MPIDERDTFDFIDAGMPAVAIQRILLETSALSTGKIYSVDGASGTSRVKDPHLKMNVSDMPTDDDANNLKITLNLSLQGYIQKNTQMSNNVSNLWLDDINIASLVSAKIYQIDAAFFELIAYHMKATAPSGADKKQWKLNDPRVAGIIKRYGVDVSQTINIADILYQMNDPAKIQKDKAKFISTNADGSETYNLPYTLDYTLPNKNPEFLAYVIITEFDHDLLVDQLIGTEDNISIGNLNTEDIKETIASLVEDVSAQSIKYDIVFNHKSLNSTAAVLMREDNNALWFGNWHAMPDGTIMTGAKHSDKSLSPSNRDKILRPIKVANTKIVDLRDDEEVNKIFLEELYELENIYDKLSKINKYPAISDKSIELSRSKKHSFDFMSSHADGSYSYILGLNKKTILLNKSSYSAIAANIINFFESSAAANATNTFTGFNDILTKTRILDLRLFRTRIDNNENSRNRLGTRINEQGSFIRPMLNTDITNSYEDSMIEEIGLYSDFATSSAIKRLTGFNFTADSSMLFLTFKDTLKSKNGQGQYQYHYEVIFEDGIRLFLEEIFLKASTDFARLKKYINFINSNLPLYYNDTIDKFNTSKIVSIFDKSEYNNNLDEIFIDLKQSLNNIFTLFGHNIASTTALQNLVTISSPSTGNYQGLLRFYDICETAINKFMSLAGFNKSALKIKKTTKLDKNNQPMTYEAPLATEGSISNLATNNTSLQKQKGSPRNSIILKERLTNIVDLENFKRTGYEYLHTDIYPEPLDDKTPAAMAGKTPDPLYMQGNLEVDATKFLDRVTAEKFKYFSQNPEDFREAVLWSIDLNSSHFLSPSRVVVDGKKIPINRRANGKFNYPALMDMALHKEAILDILRFFITKNTNKITALTVGSAELEKFDSEVSPEHLMAIKTLKKLLHTVAPMGVAFPNDLYEHSSFLSAPDTGLKKAGEKSAGVKEYESSLFKSITSTAHKANEIDDLLFGMLNGIVLEKNNKLSIFTDKDYSFPFNQNTKIPNSIKSLFMSTYGANNYPDANPAVVQQFELEDTTFETLSLSLETFGWWWFNYSNTVEIKYMSAMDESCTPTWSDLTLTALNDILGSNKRVLCKFFKYHRPQFGAQSNKMLDLPIFDEYFIIKPPLVTSEATNMLMASLAPPPLSPPIPPEETSGGVFGLPTIPLPQAASQETAFAPMGIGGNGSPLLGGTSVSSLGNIAASSTFTSISSDVSTAAAKTPGLSSIPINTSQGATIPSMSDSITGGGVPVSVMNIPETAVVSDDTLDIIENNSVFSGLITNSIIADPDNKVVQTPAATQNTEASSAPTNVAPTTTNTSLMPKAPTPKGYF